MIGVSVEAYRADRKWTAILAAFISGALGFSGGVALTLWAVARADGPPAVAPAAYLDRRLEVTLRDDRKQPAGWRGPSWVVPHATYVCTEVRP